MLFWRPPPTLDFRFFKKIKDELREAAWGKEDGTTVHPCLCYIGLGQTPGHQDSLQGHDGENREEEPFWLPLYHCCLTTLGGEYTGTGHKGDHTRHNN